MVESNEVNGQIKMTPEVVSSYKPAKSFKLGEKPVSALSFSDNGELCVTSSEDDSIHVIDCLEGKQKSTLFSKKYGVNLARFTHHSNAIVHASTKEDDTLRYLSLYDNQYLRYFQGHTDRVVSLGMSPLNDNFLSASLDGSIRLWDLRSAGCEGAMNVIGFPTVAFDPSGRVFAAGHGSDKLGMYDLRAWRAGPFLNNTVANGVSGWKGISFSNDGKHILLSTTGNAHYILDAYDCTLKHQLVGHTGSTLGMCTESVFWSPDGRFVYSGTTHGMLNVWDTYQNAYELSPMTTLSTPHQREGTRVAGHNPTTAMMVTGGDVVVSASSIALINQWNRCLIGCS
ncbi:WD40-repeat-containing domain protein [Spinellus fusiger]|nr:WD40-repeat-containing domain protein [Spinellus fusiger]